MSAGVEKTKELLRTQMAYHGIKDQNMKGK
ncbi:hypothetical protein ACUW60_000447 [Staphylococcus capitis]